MLVRMALLCGVAVPLAAAGPLVDYVTYLGGSYADTAVGIAVNSSGSAYVAGNTSSPDFPLTSTSLGAPASNHVCAFVTKLNPSGTAIEFSICLADSRATAFALDANGNIYLAVDSGVVKLDPTAQSILYKTPINGRVEALAVDAAGSIYIAGAAGPQLVATAGAYQTQNTGGQCLYPPNGVGPCNNAFIARLTPSGSIAWVTFLGGSGPDVAHGLAIDSAGNVWIAGETVSPDFPTTAGAISRAFHGKIDFPPFVYGDAFVAKLDSTGRHLLYSTYLGGSKPDAAFHVAVDAAGSAYVTGGTQSTDFPTTPGALQTTYVGRIDPFPTLGPDGFVTKLDSTGHLIYSTFTGGQGPIAVDAAGQAYLGANADSAPSPSYLRPTCGGPPNHAASVINAAGSAVVAASPIGGGYLALDGKGAIYSGGGTSLSVFFSTPHAFQIEYGGGESDAFVAKVDLSKPAGPSLASVLNAASLYPGNESPYPDGSIAPGEIVSLFGSGFGSNPTVTFRGYRAPILYASDCQINAVVPFGFAPGLPVLVTVESGAETLATVKLPVVAAAPGIFTTSGDGAGQAAVLNQDSTLNSPSNPAARGSIVSVFMTGAGDLHPYIGDGALGPLAPPFPTPLSPVEALIGGGVAPVTFAGQAPGLIAGATQVNIQVPQNAPVGDAVSLEIYVGGYFSPGYVLAGSFARPVTMAVQ